VADKDKEQKWDREMAEVDKLLARLPDADPYLKGEVTQRRPGVAGGGGGGGGGPALGGATTPVAGTVRTTGSAAWLGTWARVVLGLLIGIGMTQWPYTHGCGLKLIFYLTGVAAVIAAGFWSSLSSWRRRLGVAHVLSQALIIWGLVLAAREILPRVGYAKAPAAGFCVAPTPTPAPLPPAPH